MASEHSYTITLSNNKTEKRAFDYLLEQDKTFLLPTRDGRKQILEALGLEKKYTRAFDLFKLPGHINSEDVICTDNASDITLYELKTTAKYLPNLPKGFFFGATQNEFDLAERLGAQFKFCFVTLNDSAPGYVSLSLSELDQVIVTKRIQYQINL